MKRGLALSRPRGGRALGAVAAAGAKSNDTTISGAGSTFVAPLVSAWTPALGSAFGYNVQYSAVGSGAGIAAVTNRQVDFGASDAPLSPDAGDRLQRLRPDPVGARRRRPSPTTSRARPCTCGSTARRSRTSSSGTSRTGTIPAIAALNPGANLPNLKITPVFRSDGSGTSYNFTDYLSARLAGVEVEDRRLDPAGVPGRRRRQGLRRRRRCRQEHDRRRHLRRRRLRAHEPHPVRGRARTRPGSSSTRASGGSVAAAQAFPTVRRTTRCTSSTRRSRRRSPTRSAPTPTSSSRSRPRTRPSSGR